MITGMSRLPYWADVTPSTSNPRMCTMILSKTTRSEVNRSPHSWKSLVAPPYVQ